MNEQILRELGLENVNSYEVCALRTIKSVYKTEAQFYPGTIILIKGTELGKYWTWWECDPTVPKPEDRRLEADEEMLENFVLQVFKQSVMDYREALRKMKNLSAAKKKDDLIIARRTIKECRGFLSSSETGRYLLEVVEDEFREDSRESRLKEFDRTRYAKISAHITKDKDGNTQFHAERRGVLWQ